MPVLGYPCDMQGKLITAARALLGLSQQELAKLAGMGKQTLVNLERETGDPRRSSERRIIEILETRGVVFEETGERIGVYLKRKRDS